MPPSDTPALLLTAHGSRNAESNAIVGRLGLACGDRLPAAPVAACYLDHGQPDPATAVRALAAAGARRIVLAPLLFTAAFHATVDIPREVATVLRDLPDVNVRVTSSMAPHPALLRRLDAMLDEALISASAPTPDALVLASAGTSNAAARSDLDDFAQVWARGRGLPVQTGFASAAQPDPAAAVRLLIARGHRAVAVGMLFLGPGFLPSKAARLAIAAGACAVAQPLGDCAEVIETVLDRYQETVAAWDGAASATRPGTSVTSAES